MTKTLSLKPAFDTVIQPKPTKNEIIDAMVQVRIEKILKEQKEQEELRKQLADELRPQIIALALSKHESFPLSVDFGTQEQKYVDHEGYKPTGKVSGCDVTISLKLPPMLEKKVMKLIKIPTCFSKPNADVVRSQIKKAMSGYAPTHERVKALVENAESKKALEKTLKAIGL